MSHTSPYVSFQFPDTHPDRLCTLGQLMGLAPKDPASARVLEVACGDGGNLVPMADGLPRGRFVGFDLSGDRIEQARALASGLSIDNIQFLQCDIQDYRDAERFDYIIAHGVYSWVPGETRKAILDLVQAHLKPDGVAYLSFNAQPGWLLRSLTREILQRSAGDGSWLERVGRSRSFFAELADANSEQSGSYATLLREEAEILARSDPTYILGEHLCEVNRAFYFDEFSAALAGSSLQYICEADFHATGTNGMPPKLRDFVLRHSSNQAGREQCVDLVRGTRFRRALITHADAPVGRVASIQRAAGLRIACSARRIPESADRFELSSRRQFRVSDPSLRRALESAIAAWPRSVELSALAAESGTTSSAEHEESILRGVLWLYSGGCVELRTSDPPVSRTIGPRPATTGVVRHYAHEGRKLIPNLRHQCVGIRDTQRRLLQLLDGTRGLVELMNAANQDGGPPVDLVSVKHSLSVLAAGGFILRAD